MIDYLDFKQFILFFLQLVYFKYIIFVSSKMFFHKYLINQKNKRTFVNVFTLLYKKNIKNYEKIIENNCFGLCS